ncbi:39S ribosomal protein L14, mitochondrial-like [Eriocheir sinensis]|uniref:39S ribosomal protein L14, mitochondrial-like n=1 Tax=Eriocheir sinensis TaxID=95602 RepID=UPI0021C94763|nr:39S ribosomal protein L14, mitochondrial-like [Eriocheir sinensis]
MNTLPARLWAAGPRVGTVAGLHTSLPRQEIQKQTRLRVVDNSALGKAAMMEGRPPKCIHIYNKKGIGTTGDKVLVAIKGQKKQAILTGCHQDQKPLVPKFDSNNIVLIDENGSPLGTRIHVPIPTMLRKKLTDMSRPKGADYTKILAIATRFV